jgi:acetyl esterase/lipase
MPRRTFPLLLALPAFITASVTAQDAKPVAPSEPTAPAGKPAKSDEQRSRTVDAYSAKVPAPTVSGVKYGEHERHVLDFWKADSQSPTPLVFVIHGGGWVGGSKERVDRFVDVEQLLKAGISVASINYRLIQRGVPETEPPVKAPLHDAARALQFVRTKATEWNLDKSKIGAAGGSAGACSSLWLAFHDDLADPASADPVARESTRLFCAAVTGPQTTLDPAQMQEWTPNSNYGGHAFGFTKFTDFLAGREKIAKLIEEYSPYALVTPDDPGVYMTFSAPPGIGQPQKDPTHTSNFGVKLQEHCRSKGIATELVYPGAPEVQHATSTDYLIAKLKSK